MNISHSWNFQVELNLHGPLDQRLNFEINILTDGHLHVVSYHEESVTFLWSFPSFCICLMTSLVPKKFLAHVNSIYTTQFSILFCLSETTHLPCLFFLCNHPWNIWSPDVMKPFLYDMLSRWPVILFALHSEVSDLSAWHPETDRSNLAFPDSTGSTRAFAMNHVVFWFSWSEISFWTSFLTHNEIMVIYNQ